MDRVDPLHLRLNPTNPRVTRSILIQLHLRLTVYTVAHVSLHR